jgi:hypothetical protein
MIACDEERLSTSWTGSRASFVSQHGDHGTVPYSELAMHTRIAGLAVHDGWLAERSPAVARAS